MDTNNTLYDLNKSYRLNDIKEVTIQLKNCQLRDGTEITLAGNLYIQKWDNFYVIFQKSLILNYSIGHLEDIKQAIKSSGVSISFIHNSEIVRNEKFYSNNIIFDFITDIKNDPYYTTAIFYYIPYANYDLKNYISDLYTSHYYIKLPSFKLPNDNLPTINLSTSHNPTIHDYVTDHTPEEKGLKIEDGFRIHQPFNSVEFDDIKTLMDINLSNYDAITVKYDDISSGLTSNMDYSIFIPGIEKVIFNDPATIVFWNDGSKTVVKTQNDETYDKEKGLSMAISKKMLGNNSKYYDTFKKWIN